MKKRSNSGGRCDRPILEHRAMTSNCNLHQQHQHLEHRAMTRICISLILHQPPSSFANAQMSIYEQNCGMLMGGCMYRNYYWPQPEESISVALTTSNLPFCQTTMPCKIFFNYPELISHHIKPVPLLWVAVMLTILLCGAVEKLAPTDN